MSLYDDMSAIAFHDDPRLEPGQLIWTDPLTVFAHPHVIDDLFVSFGQLDVAFSRVLKRIDQQAELSAAKTSDRLDAMVEAGNKRQRNRHLRYEIFGTGDKREVFKHLYGGATSIKTRTYEEQRRLYERWQTGNTEPGSIAFVTPGIPSHHLRGPAIDLSDEAWFDNAGRHIRDLAEPWHFEYWGGPMKRKPWWKRALYRLGLLR